jgi:hypothetical protein
MVFRLSATLLTLLPALSSSAGQGARSFTVGARVIRSARVHAGVTTSGPPRLRSAGAGTVLVSVDGAPPRLVAGPESPLPAGASEVTVHY